MKKTITVAGLLALGFLSIPTQAFAACTANTKMSVAQLTALLPGKVVCARNGLEWKWQELHVGAPGATSGALIDYKKGPNDPVDPSKNVGNWQIAGNGNNATVVYSYTAFGAAGPYSHTVHDNGNGTYSFCGGGPEVVATVQSGPACQ